MLIRVKERGFEYEKEKNRKRGRNDREREERRGKQWSWGNCLLDHQSSVEVGYGLCYFIVNS